MIEFTKIDIEGFCSIPNLELSLNEKRVIILRGPNGFGKTNVFSAIVWAIYGKNIKGISDVNTWNKIRPKGYKGTKVSLFFKKDQHIYQIIRCQNYTDVVEGAKGGNRLIYLIDAEVVKEKGKLQIQSLIERDIEMSYNLFINSIMFGQGMKRLIQESGVDKKNLFEEIFDLKYLTEARKFSQERYNEYDSEVFKISQELNSVKANLDIIKTTVEEVKLEKTSFKEKLISEIKSLEDDKNLATKEVNKLALIANQNSYDSYNDTIKDIKSKISLIKTKLTNSKNNINNITIEELVNNLVILLQEGKYKESLNTLLSIKDDIVNIDKYTNNISKYTERLNKVIQERDKIKSILNKVEQLKHRISSLDRQIKSLEKQSPDFEHILKSNKHKIKTYTEKLNRLSKELNTNTEKRDLYKWAYQDPFGNNGIKNYLFESSLTYLNDTLKSYSETLGFHIQFRVDLDSTKKDFVTLINMGGIDVFYEELSGGQKQLVNLAVAFAMNEVMTESKGVNIAFLDEIFESLSSDNIEVVINLIKKIYNNRTLFLITHQESLPISNAKTLLVRKNNGLSSYTF